MKEKTAIQCLESTNLLTVKCSQLHMLHIFAAVQRSGEGNVSSRVCLSRRGVESRVTITRDALDLTVQASTALHHALSLYSALAPPCPRLETCSNLFS